MLPCFKVSPWLLDTLKGPNVGGVERSGAAQVKHKNTREKERVTVQSIAERRNKELYSKVLCAAFQRTLIISSSPRHSVAPLNFIIFAPPSPRGVAPFFFKFWPYFFSWPVVPRALRRCARRSAKLRRGSCSTTSCHSRRTRRGACARACSGCSTSFPSHSHRAPMGGTTSAGRVLCFMRRATPPQPLKKSHLAKAANTCTLFSLAPHTHY